MTENRRGASLIQTGFGAGKAVETIEKSNILRSHLAESVLNGLLLARGRAIMLNGGSVCD
jgi:hypothetical protein